MTQGIQNLKSFHHSFLRHLLQTRAVPEQGLETYQIDYIISELSRLDSNNFVHNCGVGEREARVICPSVSARHTGLAHGIGRSGMFA